jgi:hypothetical protein
MTSANLESVPVSIWNSDIRQSVDSSFTVHHWRTVKMARRGYCSEEVGGQAFQNLCEVCDVAEVLKQSAEVQGRRGGRGTLRGIYEAVAGNLRLQG